LEADSTQSAQLQPDAAGKLEIDELVANLKDNLRSLWDLVTQLETNVSFYKTYVANLEAQAKGAGALDATWKLWEDRAKTRVQKAVDMNRSAVAEYDQQLILRTTQCHGRN
jgi:hypothetical protein